MNPGTTPTNTTHTDANTPLRDGISLPQRHQGAQTPQTPGLGGATLDALYVHVPFCFHKCHYCDFYSIERTDPASFLAYTRRLLDELSHRAGEVRLRPASVFVGGGTPTLLPPERWREILDALQALGVLDAVREFTVEANPETVTPELLDTLRRGGVNRMSLGAQSFDPAALKTLERWHDPRSVTRAVALAREAGIDNLNLDLIFATPGQPRDSFERDLDAALELDPDHLSCYALTFEPGTALHQRMKLGLIEPMDEDEQAWRFERVLDRLRDAGFEQYEVSNWARQRPGERRDRRCLHNLAYWRNLNWLALGPSGASHVDGLRWRNRPQLTAYLDSTGPAPAIDIERLEPEARVGERLMIGLRLLEGIERSWLEAQVPTDHPRAAAIDRFVAQGLLERSPDRLRLSRRGLLVADAMFAELL